jgi:hypothetical protein
MLAVQLIGMGLLAELIIHRTDRNFDTSVPIRGRTGRVPGTAPTDTALPLAPTAPLGATAMPAGGMAAGGMAAAATETAVLQPADPALARPRAT